MYRKPVPADFKMTAEENEIAEAHGLDAEQILWRRCKIAEIGGSVDYFKREYPLKPDESFMASNFDSFITAHVAIRSVKEESDPYEPCLIGGDPAGKSADSAPKRAGRRHCITKIA